MENSSHILFYCEVSSPCEVHVSDDFTHHDQTRSVLPVGAVGSQDGDDHGDGADHIEEDEAGGPTLQLEAQQAMEWFIF